MLLDRPHQLAARLAARHAARERIRQQTAAARDSHSAQDQAQADQRRDQ